ncbi:hypothetical protein PF005_g19492 [Phytophthora fragariae]|uniref:Uncharacterized protein n=1 Tax=Phytophthora fragariae TaxID=53985 RepID=A0A6A3R2N2_9STRA|nr:hypothetical protein PF003_g12947 [Phytophthora fragariae]KAE8928897.1 hypothetical protein PF009_g20973 [Phytophthora fragariae]KAE8987697.1 hypothetical protein PF011_g19475 [Phytophthora fragariae]KAE9087450.1 hypothetical protein PF007_g20370 [Phytophthora fragariae]KAE9087809.1 hypothetical protein PF010_g19588 [Phytophthora fragariae]
MRAQFTKEEPRDAVGRVMIGEAVAEVKSNSGEEEVAASDDVSAGRESIAEASASGDTGTGGEAAARESPASTLGIFASET